MSNVKFVRPRVSADGAVTVVRHPQTYKPIAKNGESVDFTHIDVRIFFKRREAEGDVEIFDSAELAKSDATTSSAPSSTGSAAPKSRKGAEQ